MPAPGEIEASIEHVADAVVLRLRGEIDRSVAAELKELLDRVQDDEPARLVVDMSEAKYIDSAIVAVFVSAMQRAMFGAGFVVFTGLHGSVKALVEMTRLDQTVLTLAETVDAALAMPNLRRARRVAPSGMTCTAGDVLDISAGGLRLHAPKRMHGHVRLQVTVDREGFTLPGTVVWSGPVDGGYEVGVRFDGLDDDLREQLAERLGPCRPIRDG